MSDVLQTPDFKNEEEEALWWDQNEELVLAQLSRLPERALRARRAKLHSLSSRPEAALLRP